jgi:3'(2'), 5'-bisphosphate nucleotidase
MLDLPPQPKTVHYQKLIDPVCNLAIGAGALIMRFYRSGEHETTVKADKSPVTDADIAAHRLIVDKLREWTPDIPVVSEESAHRPDVADAPLFWLVDPLDGTKSFIRRTDEFTVNIALIEDKKPVFGVVYIPAQEVLYYGSEAYGAFRQTSKDAPRQIHARVQPEEGAAVVVSMSHLTRETEAFLETLTVASRVSASSSLKFCCVAEGRADIYPRFGPTCEWDTAAGHAIVAAAGGRVETVDGQPFTYAKREDFLNPGFVVWGKTAEA